MGKPIKPLAQGSAETAFVYLAESPYIIREEPSKSMLEHLGAYQLIEYYFPPLPGLKD